MRCLHSVSVAGAGAFLGILPSTNAFYVPGITAHDYKEGEAVAMKVNSLTSIKTQLPIDYYKLPFCRPLKMHRNRENLGELLAGDKIMDSPYDIFMLKSTSCNILCATEPMVEKVQKRVAKVIGHGYHHNFILDNLPGASQINLKVENMPATHYAGGFPMGYTGPEGESFIFNHLRFFIDYHQADPNVAGYRVVKFAVEPFSVNHRIGKGKYGSGATVEKLKADAVTTKELWQDKISFSEKVTELIQKEGVSGCSPEGNAITQPPLQVSEGKAVIYTYDVVWQSSEVRWATRWDVYLTENHMVPAQVHWFAIVNSIMVVVILSVMIAIILVRNLRRDIAGYNEVISDEERLEDQEESGWKLVHSDVFRPPQNFPMIFCAFVGSGVQIMSAAVSAILLSAVGFLNPARRGSLLTGLLVIFMLAGSPAGYCAARLYKTFKGRQWQKCTFTTATLFPGVVFLFFIFLNTVLVFFHTTASVPFVDILILAFMWCCVSIPLVFFGAYFGYRRDVIEFPTITSKIARAIPPSIWIMDPKISILCCGLLPFAAVYVELFFIMTSMWMGQYYYLFGFALLVCVISVITTGLLCMLLLYYQLCTEDYRWWWRMYSSAGSIAFYVFLYSCWWYPQLQAKKFSVTTIIYFGYMSIISWAIFLMMGCVGFYSCFWFTKTIYGSIKVD